MDCTNILMQGDEAKYAMRIDHDRFSMESDDFQVELFYGLMGKSKLIKKSDMTFTIDGYYYFWLLPYVNTKH